MPIDWDARIAEAIAEERKFMIRVVGQALTWPAERRNLRVHSVWNGNCSDSAQPDGS